MCDSGKGYRVSKLNSGLMHTRAPPCAQARVMLRAFRDSAYDCQWEEIRRTLILTYNIARLSDREDAL